MPAPCTDLFLHNIVAGFKPRRSSPRDVAVQVASEVEVLQALAVWTEYAPTARKPQFAARFARCVRLGNVSMAELYLLDAHPLVRSKGNCCGSMCE
jgi:hypothetical protein